MERTSKYGYMTNPWALPETAMINFMEYKLSAFSCEAGETL